MWSVCVSSFSFADVSFWALVMTLRSIKCSHVSSIGRNDSSAVTLKLKKLGLPWHVWAKPCLKLSLRCFCSSVRFLGLTLRSSFSCVNLRTGFDQASLCWHLSSDITLRVNRRAHINISRIFAILSPFWGVEWRLLLRSYWRFSRPL
jgi:hypothetical protein